MRAFAIALLAAALLALTPLKVAFCARAGSGRARRWAYFPWRAASPCACRARGRASGKGRAASRESGRTPPFLSPWAAACSPASAWKKCAPRVRWGLPTPPPRRWPQAACGRLCTPWAAATGARVVFRVRPDFHARRVDGELAGIVSLRVGHIILAALAGIWESNRRHAHGKASH